MAGIFTSKLSQLTLAAFIGKVTIAIFLSLVVPLWFYEWESGTDNSQKYIRLHSIKVHFRMNFYYQEEHLFSGYVYTAFELRELLPKS